MKTSKQGKKHPKKYRLIRDGLEQPKGVEIMPMASPSPSEPQLLLANGLILFGRYVAGVAGCGWIVQPRRLIFVASKYVVQFLGLVIFLMP